MVGWTYRDPNDIYNRISSERQFYTTPNTTVPNDQTGFAKWLASSMPKKNHYSG